MRGFSLLSGAVAAAVAMLPATVAAQASDIDPIVIKGQHMFYKTNGSEFYIRGVAYQQDFNTNSTVNSNSTYTDPLADTAGCMRDIPYLKMLRTNVIRTYAVDPTQDHSGCMNALAAADIYVISDLSAPVTDGSINRDDPSWNVALYQRYTSLVDDLSQYNNVIGFFAGNEVSNTVNTTAASAFVKAAVRDTKAYIVAQGYRQLYVGYATADIDFRQQIADYFTCGDDSTRIDFWGYNVYSWCGNSNFVASGYQERTQFFTDYPVPVFFAEYGCNTDPPRLFTETLALFSDLMTGVWSGGIVYQYFQSQNNFGLVNVDGNSVSTLSDFSRYSTQIAKVTPSSVSMSAYQTGALTTPGCPTIGASWMAESTPLPPSPNAALCDCLDDALTCVVKPSTNEDDYGDLFGFVCGNDPSACGGIVANATTGKYGAYGQCNAEQQLAYVMNEYYVGQGRASSACDFNGAATITSAGALASTCTGLLSAAGGAAGTGTVASPVVKGTAQAGAGGLATGSGAASTSKAFGVRGVSPSTGLSTITAALYVAIGLLSGAGMLLL